MKKTIALLMGLLFGINNGLVFSQDYGTIASKDLRMEFSSGGIDKSDQILKLSSNLDKLYKLYIKDEDFRQFAGQSQLKLVGDKVVVTILPQFGLKTDDIDEGALKSFGVTIQAKAENSMRVEIPITQLENIATKIEGIREIRQPMKPQELAITSEGVALMNADNWQTQGYQGSGVKVAIIDLGFNQLTAAQSNGDIPPSYVSQDFTGTGLETTTPHGTAVTEAVYDVAPQAQFYIYKIGDDTDLQNAENACKSNGVHIINHSVAWFNTGGYYDGTGDICDLASDAIANGVLWINSAGNSAEHHYRATFTPDINNFHDFSGSGGNINPIGPDPTHVWLHNIGDVIAICLNWNNYPTTNQDYDLRLYRYTGSSWVLAASSTRRQNGTLSPEETINYTNTVTDGMYGVVVYKYSATVNVDFTLFSLGYSLGYRTNANSIADPATVTDVVTVGAIDRNNYAAGPQEDFSSQGPTTDGRIKPDVAAPDNCNSFAYGYWYGTSLASPHTAGVCALIKSRFTGYTESQIRDYLYTNGTVDLGDAGKDNIYGWGKVELPIIEPLPVAEFTGSPTSGVKPLTVNFTDQSTGVITSWSWDFGDGNTSDTQNPTHTYNNAGTYTISLTVTGPGGTDSEIKTNYITVNEPAVLVQIKLFLEGAYNTTTDEMSTTLKAGEKIPLNSPYTEDARTVTAVPADVTDWVLVQLRSTADGAAVASRSVFLHKNGNIVADDGTTGQIEQPAAAGNYFIVIKQRNHLAVMSATAIALSSSSSSTLYDFTIGSDKYYGTGGAKELESGVWGMWSGDIDQDKQITTSDYTVWYNSARAGDSGYQLTDINLDAQVTTSDYTIWYNNARAGASSTLP